MPFIAMLTGLSAWVALNIKLGVDLGIALSAIRERGESTVCIWVMGTFVVGMMTLCGLLGYICMTMEG